MKNPAEAGDPGRPEEEFSQEFPFPGGLLRGFSGNPADSGPAGLADSRVS